MTSVLEGVRVRGLPMELHPVGEGVSDHIRREEDFYEAPILDYLREHFPAQRVIVDVGAMIGNHSLYWAALHPHEQVYAFEPLPANFALLGRNLVGRPSVHLYQLALSDAPGTLRMTPAPSNMGASAITNRGPIEVQAVTLDSLALADVTLLKIDVEEHEDRVLAGARETIDRWHPLVLVEDWHGTCGALLPGYHCIAEWPGSNYLYQWGES